MVNRLLVWADSVWCAKVGLAYASSLSRKPSNMSLPSSPKACEIRDQCSDPLRSIATRWSFLILVSNDFRDRALRWRSHKSIRDSQLFTRLEQKCKRECASVFQKQCHGWSGAMLPNITEQHHVYRNWNSTGIPCWAQDRWFRHQCVVGGTVDLLRMT